MTTTHTSDNVLRQMRTANHHHVTIVSDPLCARYSGSSSSSGPPTCAERPPPERADADRPGDTEYLLAQPPAPFGMDLDVPSNRSSRVLSPPPVGNGQGRGGADVVGC